MKTLSGSISTPFVSFGGELQNERASIRLVRCKRNWPETLCNVPAEAPTAKVKLEMVSTALGSARRRFGAQGAKLGFETQSSPSRLRLDAGMAADSLSKQRQRAVFFQLLVSAAADVA